MATQPIQSGPATPDGPARRNALRRARGGGSGGFSSGSLTQSESLRTEHEVQDETDLEEPDLNAQVRANVPRLPPPTTSEEGVDDGGENRRRLFEAAMAGDPTYARDQRLHLINRLLLRGVSYGAIAQELGVSVGTVRNDVTELRRRHRERAVGLDINELIGSQIAFYDEATAVSLRIVSQQDMPTPMRLAGVRTALAAKADQTRFLTNAGVFDVLQFRRAEDGTNLSDVQMLMARTEEILENLSVSEDGPQGPEPGARPVVVRRRRSNGFTPMGFGDRGASNSTDEIVEI